MLSLVIEVYVDVEDASAAIPFEIELNMVVNAMKMKLSSGNSVRAPEGNPLPRNRSSGSTADPVAIGELVAVEMAVLVS